VNPALSIAVGLLVIVLITAATAYFVAQEFAYISVNRSRLAARARAGDRAAAQSLAITQRTSFMLSGAQLGITVTGLLVGYVAEPLVGRALGEILGVTGLSTAISVGIGAAVALIVSTFVQMLFGELYPKNLAISNPGPVADALAPSTTWYLRLFGWLIWIFDRASNALLRLLRIEPVHDVEHSATAHDLRSIVAESREAATLSPAMSTLLDRVLDFYDRDVEHAMIPRSKVDILRADATVGEVREEMAGGGHTRYPVLAEDSEDLLGFVDLNDILATELPDDAPIAQITREPLVVSHLESLTSALEQLGEGGRIACVVDEYGGFTGVLTLDRRRARPRAPRDAPGPRIPGGRRLARARRGPAGRGHAHARPRAARGRLRDDRRPHHRRGRRPAGGGRRRRGGDPGRPGRVRAQGRPQAPPAARGGRRGRHVGTEHAAPGRPRARG
jgi:CBS domain containing-hemolysin-like protein